MKKSVNEESMCPKCGKHLVPYLGFSAGLIYECKNCSYRGPVSLKKVKTAPHIEED